MGPRPRVTRRGPCLANRPRSAQQRDRDGEQHAEARVRLTDREWQQERDRHREQQAEARARLTDREWQ
ncbi:unnamed protein product [Sphagnum balticum]